MRVSPSSPADIESAPFATESRSDAVANMLDWSSMAAGAYGEKVLASRGWRAGADGPCSKATGSLVNASAWDSRLPRIRVTCG